MGRDVAKRDGVDLAGLIGPIARDAGRLIGQHADLLRAEVREGLSGAIPAVASIGAGVGLVATGGVLGSMMLVHGLHRASRLPLWGCYGLVGGVMATVGLGLLGSGARRVGSVRLVPRETIEALRDDVRWIMDKTNPAEA